MSPLNTPLRQHRHHQGPSRPRDDPLLARPSARHLLGTDQFGRDVLARLVYGARLSVSIGAASVALALLLGVPIGALSGFIGGALDNALMRAMDALMAFPALLLALGLVAMLGPGTTSPSSRSASSTRRASRG